MNPSVHPATITNTMITNTMITNTMITNKFADKAWRMLSPWSRMLSPLSRIVITHLGMSNWHIRRNLGNSPRVIFNWMIWHSRDAAIHLEKLSSLDPTLGIYMTNVLRNVQALIEMLTFFFDPVKRLSVITRKLSPAPCDHYVFSNEARLCIKGVRLRNFCKDFAFNWSKKSARLANYDFETTGFSFTP